MLYIQGRLSPLRFLEQVPQLKVRRRRRRERSAVGVDGGNEEGVFSFPAD